MTSLFLGRFRLVFERIQNNGGRRLMQSGIAIIYLILLFKMSKLKLDPCCSVVGCSLWPGTDINL